jgi:hypothetical protein
MSKIPFFHSDSISHSFSVYFSKSDLIGFKFVHYTEAKIM